MVKRYILYILIVAIYNFMCLLRWVDIYIYINIFADTNVCVCV